MPQYADKRELLDVCRERKLKVTSKTKVKDLQTALSEFCKHSLNAPGDHRHLALSLQPISLIKNTFLVLATRARVFLNLKNAGDPAHVSHVDNAADDDVHVNLCWWAIANGRHKPKKESRAAGESRSLLSQPRLFPTERRFRISRAGRNPSLSSSPPPLFPPSFFSRRRRAHALD